MRHIVLDTETTGFEPAQGHRMVELACVELLHHLPTGKHFHAYLNPERDVPEGAVRVHGLTEAFLSDKPLFSQVVEEFLAFIGDAPLIIHNASFDMAFLNAELKRVGFPPLAADRPLDTLALARQKFPGEAASLDALCKRFKINNSQRTFHGALLDAQLLAEVYLELIGGRQVGFGDMLVGDKAAGSTNTNASTPKSQRVPRLFPASAEELAAHTRAIQTLQNALWNEPACA